MNSTERIDYLLLETSHNNQGDIMLLFVLWTIYFLKLLFLFCFFKKKRPSSFYLVCCFHVALFPILVLQCANIYLANTSYPEYKPVYFPLYLSSEQVYDLCFVTSIVFIYLFWIDQLANMYGLERFKWSRKCQLIISISMLVPIGFIKLITIGLISQKCFSSAQEFKMVETISLASVYIHLGFLLIISLLFLIFLGIIPKFLENRKVIIPIFLKTIVFLVTIIIFHTDIIDIKNDFYIEILFIAQVIFLLYPFKYKRIKNIFGKDKEIENVKDIEAYDEPLDSEDEVCQP
ncbi:hypothetical protein CYY_006661 [Polysphondylium violaceum]|uniref:Uncharacterized protein n=1 Tax=Polysphondylium violaceum TaxID=133409 RepID=A0A8J4PQA4_9MYCE|nr:hypothetical protein CYY_006661 [Polysphondylium violaceum]